MSSADAVKRAMCAKPREGTWPSGSSPHLKKTSVCCHIRGEIYSRAYRSSVAHLSWLRLKIHLGSSALVFTERRRRRRKWKEAAPHDLEGWTGTALNPLAGIGKLVVAASLISFPRLESSCFGSHNSLGRSLWWAHSAQNPVFVHPRSTARVPILEWEGGVSEFRR
ncbi:unnamed protein product [Musa acuminata subsp. malaccensis]|uniref:(wild Malaysian banana) hypothetical protein n=1 Tax=Musa acuminata subsp. malaccensis TaxID=214687 RepID=A0A804K2J4_MUSAM|nr:unnamed protein product [Musa acuminata subsp. malaccensis]